MYIYIYIDCFRPLIRTLYRGTFQKSGALFGGPYNEDHSILGSRFVPLIFGNSHIVGSSYRRSFDRCSYSRAIFEGST